MKILVGLAVAAGAMVGVGMYAGYKLRERYEEEAKDLMSERSKEEFDTAMSIVEDSKRCCHVEDEEDIPECCGDCHDCEHCCRNCDECEYNCFEDCCECKDCCGCDEHFDNEIRGCIRLDEDAEVAEEASEVAEEIMEAAECDLEESAAQTDIEDKVDEPRW